MNQEQMNAAKKALTDWLAHPQELGKAPTKIECAGEFDLYDMHYYIFKYKKGLLGKWLLGVCGGYEGDSLEHCGHVFSEMQEYVEATAKEEAIKLVEFVRAYYMDMARKAEERKENNNSFLSFVLLEDAEWKKETFLKALKEEWQIEPDAEEEDDKAETDSKEGAEDKAEGEEDMEAAIFHYHGAMVTVALMPGPIPEDEVEYHASNHYLWKEAVETSKKHQAHLVVAVFRRDMSAVEAGQLQVKLVATCCKQKNALGIYTNETVFMPQMYCDFADMMKQDMFPLFNLVWFGLYQGKKGTCGYTVGLANFGYDEIEILESAAKPSEVREFLADIAIYIIQENVILRDGETIGFSEEQKLPITKSRGVAVEGDSLKIGF